MRGMATLGLHGLFGGLPGVLLGALLGPGAGSASAEPWRVSRHVDDCDPPCHFHDLTLETPDPGGGVRYAMESPSVLSGDSVEVWPGVYLAPFAMESDVILFSREGPGVTVLGTASSGTQALCEMVACGPGTVIDGFTFVWDHQTTGIGGGLAAYASGGTVRNNVFRDSQASFGSGVYLQFCDLTLENNVFANNSCASGGGVLAVTAGQPIIRNNTFVGSVAPFGFEGAAYYASGSRQCGSLGEPERGSAPVRPAHRRGRGSARTPRRSAGPAA